MKRLVVLSGAGISAESGLKTFREMGGLWEEYDISEVATPEAWQRNPELVLRFYNERRKALLTAIPNAGHTGLVGLEKYFDVRIITQNVDDLHERAGSSFVLHLHGELKKSRSTADEHLVYDIPGSELKWGDRCEKGSQLRPHIVWFGEAVPMMDRAIKEVEGADVFVVVGTSLQVYPAASLIDYVSRNVPVYLIDPNETAVGSSRRVTFIREKASAGVAQLLSILTDPE
ncbi:MAG: NAD-dependent protein deacylase [Bacteroidetes bacterium GWF2_49_14]|nr:MAG: NAD-dependent protein deacylase [Bacteroidetes bacterium GWF2_49_14]HBB91248.1 NAD-dependent protein deacylase [Bacteroidales bacterium]